MKMQKISVGKSLAMAFGLWRKTMKYNILFSLVYWFLLGFLVAGVITFTNSGVAILDYLAYSIDVTEGYIERNPKREAEILSKIHPFLSPLLLIVIALVQPLWVGLWLIMSKIQEEKTASVGDLFIGYNGADFLKYAGFYALWMMIIPPHPLGMIWLPFWIIITLFVVPIMFFKKEPLGIAMLMSFQAVIKNILPILLMVAVAGVLNYLGLLLFGFGLIFTLPFWAAMIFSLYQQIFDNEELKNNN